MIKTVAIIIGMSDGINLSFLFMVNPSSAGFQFLSFLISVSRSFCPTHQNILVSVVFFARKLAPSKITTLIMELASPTAEAKLY